LAALSACSDPTGVDSTEPPPTSGYVFVRDYRGATLGDRITAAIRALPPSGGIVDASDISGDHRIDATIHLGSATKPIELRLGSVRLVASAIPFTLYNRSKLIGNGLTAITQQDGANLPALVTGAVLDGCEIAHLTIDGNRAGNSTAASAIHLSTAKRCWLHHLSVQNTVGRLHPGIRFADDGNADNTIEHNLLLNIGTLVDYADGIYIAGPGNKVLFNRIRRASDFGVVAESCSGCVIQGNDIIDVPGGIALGSGVANLGAGANIIDGNIITGGLTTTWGVISVYRIFGASPAATIVKGNIIRDVEQGHGIFVNGAEHVSLDGNILSNIGVGHHNYGIAIQNSTAVTVQGGMIDRTGSFGIGIGGSTNVQVNGVLITDAARAAPGASGIGLDVTAGTSVAVSLVNLHVFDREPDPSKKLMGFCVDFAQGGTTTGVLIGGNLFDDGVNAVGCRDGAMRLSGATRVTTY
jgi:hypothetical protein